MSEENPYRPPESDAVADRPTAPKPFGWKLIGKQLWVREVAQFPMVDPCDGSHWEVMELQRVLVRHQPLWLWLMPSGLVAAWVLLSLAAGSGVGGVLVGVMAGLILGSVLQRVAMGFRSSCVLRVFVSRWRSRLVKWLGRVAAWSLGLAIFGAFTIPLMPAWISDWSPALYWALGGMMFLGLFALLCKSLMENRYRCRRRKEGWWQIHGFRRRALKRLEREPQCPDREEPRGNLDFPTGRVPRASRKPD